VTFLLLAGFFVGPNILKPTPDYELPVEFYSGGLERPLDRRNAGGPR
jgi:hypothetical protein